MNTSIQTLTFIFDNETDHILLFQSAEEGPMKRKHSGIKGVIGTTEEFCQAAIRSIEQACGLIAEEPVLRGVVKAIQEETQSSIVYLIYESSRFSGEMGNKLQGRMKWVDILDIFNLQMEGFVHEIMPNLLDGESFFEGSVYLSETQEILKSEIRICNSI